MEEYDTRRSTAVIISHERIETVHQILPSDPVPFDRQMLLVYVMVIDHCDSFCLENFDKSMCVCNW